MNTIFYLLIVSAVVAWIRHSLCSVPSSVPPPRRRTMRGMPIRKASAPTSPAQRSRIESDRE